MHLMRSGSSAKTSITVVIIIIVVIALARKTTAVVVANASRVVNKRVVGVHGVILRVIGAPVETRVVLVSQFGELAREFVFINERNVGTALGSVVFRTQIANTIESCGASPSSEAHRDTSFPLSTKRRRGAGGAVVHSLLTYLFNERANSGTECSGAFDGERDELDVAGLEILLDRGVAIDPYEFFASFRLVRGTGLNTRDVFTLAPDGRLGRLRQVGFGISRDDINSARREPLISGPALDEHISRLHP